MAEDSSCGARRDGALVGRGAGHSEGQDPVWGHCRLGAFCPIKDEED